MAGSPSLHHLLTAARQALEPDTVQTVSEWAEAHRILSRKASAEPGRWRTSRTPYLRAIMDALSARHPAERVVFMKGSQVGATEVGLNWIGYTIHRDPGPFLMVQPTDLALKRYSRQRLDPMIEDSPELAVRISDPRSRDAANNAVMKEFPGGVIILAGANSPSNLRSMPARKFFGDEVDAYPISAGMGQNAEGDPVDLAERALQTFWNSKEYLCSTPLKKGSSRIEKAFLEGNQQYYFVPCPECGEFQILKWAQVQWPEGRPQEAHYVCEHCGAALSEGHKQWMLEHGQWRAISDGDGRTWSFHLSSLYSPPGWESWRGLALKFTQARNDPLRLQVFVNQKLGEPWEEDGERPPADSLAARREEFAGLVPPDAAVITAGVDVQDDRLEAHAIAWGEGEECWSIDYQVFYGDPSAPHVWDQLDTWLSRPWEHARDIPPLTIGAACIDTGGHHTLKAYAFCKGRHHRKVWAIKGRGGQGVPIWPRKPSAKNKGKVPLYIVGVDAAKEAIYARLKVDTAGPGYIHFSAAYDDEWFRHLTSEKKITRYHKGKSKTEWVKGNGVRNEPFDTFVYSLAALYGWVNAGLSLGRRVAELADAPLRKSRAANPQQLAEQAARPPRVLARRVRGSMV